MLRVDYTATAASLELLAPHQAPLEELCVAAAQWDPLTGPAAGDVAVGADLALCNHAWGPVRTEPRLLVANLASGAKESGFVLLHTLLKGETVGEAVAFLSSTAQSSSQQGLLTQVCLNRTFFHPAVTCCQLSFDYSDLVGRLSGRKCSQRLLLTWWLSGSLSTALPSFCVAVSP